jgi:hypothetical protein
MRRYVRPGYRKHQRATAQAATVIVVVGTAGKLRIEERA